MPEQREWQVGLLAPDDFGELHDVPHDGAHPAGAERAELRQVAAGLLDAGLAVPSVVVGVDRVTGRDEPCDQRLVPARVFAEPVHELHDTVRSGRFPRVVVHGDALRIDERVVVPHRGELDH